jgi:4-hydroxybenzoyl-CoA thioesterase
MAETFVLEQPIRFADCDPAGIVYFPRYLEMMNHLVEDWFRYGLGMSFADMHSQHKLGVPVVNTKVDFVAAARLGDELHLDLAIARLGHSSLELAITGAVNGEVKLRARHRIATISLESFRAIAIPEDLREKMEAYVIDPTPEIGPVPTTHKGEIPPNAFRSIHPVRFSHCDPAGIVFYPRFFDLFVSTLEDWFSQGLEVPLDEVINKRQLGVPTVTITAEFLKACRFGEMLEIDLWVQRVGRSSMELRLAGTVKGELRLKAAWTVVMLDHGTFRSTAIPDDLRHRVAMYTQH